MHMQCCIVPVQNYGDDHSVQKNYQEYKNGLLAISSVMFISKFYSTVLHHFSAMSDDPSNPERSPLVTWSDLD